VIFVKNTPNHAGVAIYGDQLDFHNLYEALHDIVGSDEECERYYSARIRVLGVCYDLRHALMGDREIEFVDNGIDDDMRRYMAVIAPDKNVYFKINVLWPEILFVTMVLNDFILLYAQKKAKLKYDVLSDKQNIWDPSIAAVRSFQAAVAGLIKETVSDSSFSRMMNLMNERYWAEDYTWQYLDVLNCRFLEMDSEKRSKSLLTMVKRLVERGQEYQTLRATIKASAKHYNTWEDNIKAPVDYPEDIEW